MQTANFMVVGILQNEPTLLVNDKNKTYSRFTLAVTKKDKTRFYDVIVRKGYKKTSRYAKGDTIMVQGRPIVEIEQYSCINNPLETKCKGRLVVKANKCDLLG
jgi:hypothetical protein